MLKIIIKSNEEQAAEAEENDEFLFMEKLIEERRTHIRNEIIFTNYDFILNFKSRTYTPMR